MKDLDFGVLVGQTLKSVERKNGTDGDSIVFITQDDKTYLMYHYQDCCEGVYIEDICGDLSDLVGSPIIRASEDSNHDNPKEGDDSSDESFTWTFYNIATAKGHVTIRWYGTSNGYYSESVYFGMVEEGEEGEE